MQLKMLFVSLGHALMIFVFSLPSPCILCPYVMILVPWLVVRSCLVAMRLLRRALHTFATSMHIIVILIHGAHASSATITLWVELLEQEVVHHGV